MFLSIRTSESVRNPAFFDFPWSLMHFWIGIQIAIILKYFNCTNKINLLIIFIIHTIYEIFDYYYSYIIKIYKEDSASSSSFKNSIGDTICNLVGAILYLKLSKQKPSGKLVIFSIIFTVIFFHFSIYYGGGWEKTWKKHIKLRLTS